MKQFPIKKKLSLTPLIGIQAQVKNHTIRALYDPGANISMINDEFVKKIKTKYHPNKNICLYV